MTDFAIKAPRGKFHAADFQPDVFSQLIYKRGLKLKWEQAELCPCRESATSDAGRRGCPVCDSSGWIWHTPTEVRAVVTSASLDEDTFNRVGPHLDGMVFITVEPEQLPGRFDRYTALESVFIFREIATRTAGATQALKLPIAQRTLKTLKTGPKTIGVLRARAQLSTGVAAANPLVQDVDLDVTPAGLIDWTKGDALGTAPAVGKQFSCAYTASPIWVVQDHPYAVRDTRGSPKEGTRRPEQMPVKALCKLKFGT